MTDEFAGGGSPTPDGLRAALERVVATIRAFAATLPAQSGKPAAEAPRLPQWSGRPGVTLLAVDPYLVHAYWDFDLAKLPPDTVRAVLRFYDAASHFDVDVDLRTGSWYVPLWSPAKTYCADLGAITAAGEFIPLVRSNIIQTSRAWPAAEVEHRFVSGAAVSSQSEEPAGPQPPPFPSAPAGILEIALRADGSSLAADPPEEEQAGPAVSLAPPPDGGGHAHQATGAPETTPPTGQPRSKPPDAAEILRRTLSEIGEFRQRPPQAHRGAVEGPQAIPPLPATADPPGDLTERAERAFSPGLSSLLPGAQGPKGE